MSDDKAPDTIEVLSEDIIRSGPVERGVHAVGQGDDGGVRYAGTEDIGVCVIRDANQRAEHWKNACAEADRRVKELERELDVSRQARRIVEGQLGDVRHLAIAADNELAHWERAELGCGVRNRFISNARAALTKAKETL